MASPPLAGSQARLVGVDQAVAVLGGLNEDLVLRADGTVRTLTVPSFGGADIAVTVSQGAGLPVVDRVACGPLHGVDLARGGSSGPGARRA